MQGLHNAAGRCRSLHLAAVRLQVAAGPGLRLAAVGDSRDRRLRLRLETWCRDVTGPRRWEEGAILTEGNILKSNRTVEGGMDRNLILSNLSFSR